MLGCHKHTAFLTWVPCVPLPPAPTLGRKKPCRSMRSARQVASHGSPYLGGQLSRVSALAETRRRVRWLSERDAMSSSRTGSWCRPFVFEVRLLVDAVGVMRLLGPWHAISVWLRIGQVRAVQGWLVVAVELV